MNCQNQRKKLFKYGEKVNATFYYEYYEEYGIQKKVLKKQLFPYSDMWDYLSDGYDIDENS